MPMYRVTVDSGEDDTFATSLTSRVRQMTWHLGMRQAGERVAPPGEAQLTLDNRDGALSGVGGADLIGRCIRIEAQDGAGWQVLFTGFIARVAPETGAWGSPAALITAHTVDAGLRDVRAHLPPFVQTRVDLVLTALVAAAPLRRRALRQAWVLDVGGFSNLGTARIGADLPVETAFDAAQSTLVYASFGLDARADLAVERLVEAERGWWSADRAGQLVFRNRHALLRSTPPAATFADAFHDAHSLIDGGANRVQVWCTPRAVGPPLSALWTLPSAQRVPPGTRQITARFSDATGRRIGALSISGLTFSANTKADGSGAPVTLEAEVTLRGADSAVLTWHNRTGQTAWVLPGAALTGTPLLGGTPVEVVAADGVSIAFHGVHERALDLPLLDDFDDAGQIARFELARAPVPEPRLTRVTIDAVHRPDALARSPFDRVALSETASALSGEYWITGEGHHVDRGGTRHHITWVVEPALPVRFWTLDASALDSASTIAY
jgi:hypothetical protein